MWNDLYLKFEDDFASSVSEGFYRAPQNYYSKEILNSFRQLQTDESKYINDCLLNPVGQAFVKTLVDAANFVPKSLLSRMVECAVRCDNPSFNKQFLISTIRQNQKKVLNELLRFLREGDAHDKAGAASAFYWYFSLSTEVSIAEKELILEEMAIQFISCEVLSSRRSILGVLTSASISKLATEIKNKINSAFLLAESIDDEYIQNRIAMVRGENVLISPLPPRENDG